MGREGKAMERLIWQDAGEVNMEGQMRRKLATMGIAFGGKWATVERGTGREMGNHGTLRSTGSR